MKELIKRMYGYGPINHPMSTYIPYGEGNGWLETKHPNLYKILIFSLFASLFCLFFVVMGLSAMVMFKIT